MEKKKLKTFPLLIFIFGVVTLFLILINAIIVLLGDEIQNVNRGYQLEKYIEKNNLTLPVPVPENNLLFQVNPKEFFKEKFSLPPNDFKTFINVNYKYELNSYNCKYWSYIYTLYFQENKERFNWKFKYITTENHIFTMIYNQSGYIIGDGKNLECYGEIC